MPRPVKGEDIGWQGETQIDIKERNFLERGDDRYALEVPKAGILIEVDRLRRERHELHGEVLVTINGHFPNAKTIRNGVLSIADLNLSSAQARNTRAKFLGVRSDAPALDWYGLLEEFCYAVLTAERFGGPAQILADIPETDDSTELWSIDGLPILQKHPTVFFGTGESAKSYMAMWVAAQLCTRGLNVLYADWEWDGGDHSKRLGRMFRPKPRNLFYLKAKRPLRYEYDRIRRLLKHHDCQFLVCDSVAPACAAPANESESATNYFGMIRELNLGSLHVAHPPKGNGEEGGRRPRIHGSVFFEYLARSIWWVEKASQNPENEIRIGMYQDKYNGGAHFAPRAYRLNFNGPTTIVERIDIKSVEELASNLPLLDRVEQALSRGALPLTTIAELVDASPSSVRKILSRHASHFTRLPNKRIGLSSNEPDLPIPTHSKRDEEI